MSVGPITPEEMKVVDDLSRRMELMVEAIEHMAFGADPKHLTKEQVIVFGSACGFLWQKYNEVLQSMNDGCLPAEVEQ